MYRNPNKERKSKKMKLQETAELPIFEFSKDLKGIKPKVTFKPVKKYRVPTENLPKELKGKIKKQFVIEYQTEEQTIEIGNRTITISPFKAWENSYEQ